MGLGGVEWLEDVFHALWIYPWSRILNRNAHGSLGICVRLVGEDATSVSDPTQCVQRVHHQVHQDLLHLDAVCSHLGKIWSQSSLHRYLSPLGLSFGQCDDFSNYLIQAEPGLDRFATFQK